MFNGIASRSRRWGSSPARGIVLCSLARHFALAVSLSTQVFKWVPANLMLRVTLQ